MLYRWIFLQLLLLYIELYPCKMNLKPFIPTKDIDVSSDEVQSIVVLIPPVLRSRSLSIEDLEPSKSLVVRPTNPVEDDLTVESLNLSKRQKDILRRKWRSSCDREAAKVCVKACKSTVKIVCSSFECKKRMKKSFKKECKANCKSRFISSKNSGSD